MGFKIKPDDPERPQVRALLERHLTLMHKVSPRDSVHALDSKALTDPTVSFWTIWDDDLLVGCGALKAIDNTQCEIKSMHTVEEARGCGVGAAMLEHILTEARSRSFDRISLETGAQQAFAPARALYAGVGFVECPPFGSYKPDPNSVFMTLELK